MTSLRERFTVAWDDREPIEVTTTVQDLIDAVEGVAARGYSNNRVALETSLIHAALVRTRADAPPYDEWVNLLDTYEKVRKDVPTEGPTGPGPSPSEP